MGLVETFREAHQRTIEDNPVELMIRRTGKLRNDTGGFSEVDGVYVGQVRSRLYQETTGRVQQGSEPVQGLVEVQPRWGLALPLEMQVADPETGVLLVIDDEPVMTPLDFTDAESPDVTYWFDHALLGRFEFHSVYPNQDLGETWGWRAECERKS